MNAQDYRIVMTIASNIAQPTWVNGKVRYLLDFEQFVNAIDNIYPDICIPVVRNGVTLNLHTSSESSKDSTEK